MLLLYLAPNYLHYEPTAVNCISLAPVRVRLYRPHAINRGACLTKKILSIHTEHMIHDCTHLFPLPHPPLNSLPRLRNALLHLVHSKPRVNTSEAPSLLNTLPNPQMRIGNNGEPSLILPDQPTDIVHGNRQQHPGRTDTETDGSRSPEEDVPVTNEDASGHGGHEDVDGSWHQTLAGLRGWGKGGDCACEGLLQVEDAGEQVVDGCLGRQGLVVEGEADFAYLGG